MCSGSHTGSLPCSAAGSGLEGVVGLGLRPDHRLPLSQLRPFTCLATFQSVEMSRPQPEQAPVTFSDVAAYFSEEEWRLLHQWQKELYRNVMKEIQQALTSLGPLIAASVFSLRAKEKEGRCPVDSQDLEREDSTNCSPSVMIASPDVIVSVNQDEKRHMKYPQQTDRRERSDCRSTGDGAIAPIVSFMIKEESYSMDHQVSERRESSSGSSGFPILNTDISLRKEDESSVSLTDHPGADEGESSTGHSSEPAVVSFIIKEEDESYSMVDEISETRQSIHSPTDVPFQIKEEIEVYCIGDQGSDQRESITMSKAADKSETGSVKKKKPHICSECKRIFTHKSTLQQHQRIHTGEKPFSCTECKKSFTLKSDLHRHQRIHTGEKPFHCTECNKRFTAKRNLLHHLRIHTGEKPFPCTVCKKSFIRKTGLQYHLRMHTGEKPFHCTECKKNFTQKTSLLQHMRIHTGERPFPCTECNKSFIQKTGLQHHMRIHTGVKDTNPESEALCLQ